jgi:hypothetical protein
LAELTDSLTRPFVNLIEQDPLANKALEKLRAHQLAQPDAIDMLRQDTPFTLTYDAISSAPQDVVSLRSLGFVPPYDFQWAWHDRNGHPPFNIVQNRQRSPRSGRSGSVPGGASGFVNAHAGFGVFLRSDVTTQKYPHAVLNPGNYSFQLRAPVRNCPSSNTVSSKPPSDVAPAANCGPVGSAGLCLTPTNPRPEGRRTT